MDFRWGSRETPSAPVSTIAQASPADQLFLDTETCRPTVTPCDGMPPNMNTTLSIGGSIDEDITPKSVERHKGPFHQLRPDHRRRYSAVRGARFDDLADRLGHLAHQTHCRGELLEIERLVAIT